MSEAGPPIENKAFRDLITIVSQLEKRISILEKDIFYLIEWKDDIEES